jgi:hypothetical protein
MGLNLLFVMPQPAKARRDNINSFIECIYSGYWISSYGNKYTRAIGYLFGGNFIVADACGDKAMLLVNGCSKRDCF